MVGPILNRLELRRLPFQRRPIAEPGTALGKDFGTFMQAEAKKWGEVVRISGAHAE